MKPSAQRKGAIGIVQKFFPKVTKVTDATENATIEVTQRDAASKAVKDHNACVMAVACKRKLHLDGVIIARSVAYLIKNGEAIRYNVPPSLSREIVSFDRGAGFELGKYELAKIQPNQKLGERQKRRDERNGFHGQVTTKPEPKFKHMTTNIRSILGGQRPEGE